MTWLLLAGLIACWAGERIVGDVSALRPVLTGAGGAALLAATLLRARSWARAAGDARAVEGLFLLTYVGCTAAAAVLLLAGGGFQWLGLAPEAPEAARRLVTAAQVVGSVLLSISLLPALAAQWATGGDYVPGGPTASVDRIRVTQVAQTALTIGLALPLLLLTGYVAKERDRTLDVSYFRTSSPGTASQQIALSLEEPLEVLLFFPPGSAVLDPLRGYFRALAQGGNVRVQEYDFMVSPDVAQEHGVVRDGTIVLASGERRERIALPLELRAARGQLRTLDEDVQQALMRVAREQRTVYLTVGHGELNDPGSARAMDTLSVASSTYKISSMLQYLNFEERQLGVARGLGNEVPEDAIMVLVLGPRRPFLDAELGALERYLQRGGSVLFALEPNSEFQLGPLAALLGVDFVPTQLIDDQNHLVDSRQRSLSDRRMLITDMIFSHGATAMSSQGGIGSGMVFIGSGYLEPRLESTEGLNILVRSMDTAVPDANGDFQTSPGEERFQYPIASARALPAQGPATISEEMRAIVYADADFLTDFFTEGMGLNETLLYDALRWLGREEELAGETSSEADVPIVHTRQENIAWFYATILGAPSLVLVLGLLAVRRRRLRQTREALA